MAVRIAICQRIELSPVEQPEYGIANPEIGVYKQHAQEVVMFWSRIPVLLQQSNTGDHSIEGPVFGVPNDPPCYVTDHSGHSEYMSAFDSDYTFHDRRS